LAIPVIPTFGNNDILPHNIFLSGPNKWLKAYTDIWSNFIPEEQRHGFQRGGWFWVEVIPQKLAVFSLNTLYFFDRNAAVDGCALRSEPGYEHMEWLRIQLQFMRLRGLKAILTGHVPPARTDSKQLWDETCWQKYTLWLRQYRDVVVGGLYGHMNIDHFMLQDAKEVDLLFIDGQSSEDQSIRALMDEELSIESASDYLKELRENWSSLPNPSSAIKEYDEAESEIDDIPEEATKKKNKKGKKSKKDKRFKKIGGPWGERYQVTNVGPSVVPNYFPTLRVIEYNITSLDKTSVWANPAVSAQNQELDWLDDDTDSSIMYMNEFLNEQLDFSDDESITRKKKKHKKPKNPDLIVPPPPSKSSPPGPAYSPQTLTLLGYTQYFTNLTHINNDDIVKPDEIDIFEDEIDADKWREGKHKGKHPKNKLPHPKPFQYEVEYDTFTDSIYKLKDMTVRSWLNLAHRIGRYKPAKGDELDETILDGIKEGDDDFDEDDYDDDNDDEFEVESGKKHRKKKHHRQHEKNKVWLRFIRHAFISTLEDKDLHTFDQIPGRDVLAEETGSIDVHDGEL
jgi:endopolyphosphatase